MSAGSGIAYRGGAAFSVSIALTESGLANREKVLHSFFRYVELLRRAGPSRAAYGEQARLSELAFRFQPEESAIRYVTRLAGDMHQYAPADILQGGYLMEDFDARLIEDILDRYITAENVAVMVIAEGLPVDRRSTFYDVAYSARSLGTDDNGDDDGEAKWRRAAEGELDPRLHLPAPNEFIPEDLKLVKAAPGNPPAPQLAEDGERLRLWFRQDTEFREPRGALYISFRNRTANNTAANAAAARLYTALLRDAVNEFAYPAWLAGLNFTLATHSRGISLKISGYNDKQVVLLERIAKSITVAKLDTRRFPDIREQLVRALENKETIPAFRQVMDDARTLLASGEWDEVDLIRELKRLTPAAVAAYAQSFWASTEVDVMLNGNYASGDADAALKALAPLTAFTQKATPPMNQVVKLAPKEDLLFKTPVESTDAVFFWYLQGRAATDSERAFVALTAQVLGSDFFDELRTRQQLGYVVSAFPWLLHQVPAVAFLVQSPSAALPDIRAAAEAFLPGRLDPKTLSSEQFARHRTALVSDILKPHRNLQEASEYFWRQIARRDLDFDARERLAEAVRAINYEDWRTWYREVILQNPAALAVVAPGQSGELPQGTPVPPATKFQKTRKTYHRP